jgi:mannose-6-phosphate isomerase-like protein (cupin superfamily)
VQVGSRDRAQPFTTLDGSTIRVLLDAVAGDAANQSLAEAELGRGQETQRHYHAVTEEIYVLLEGHAEMEVDGDQASVQPGDAILIPAGARHQIRAGESGVRFLCCCAPPYSDEDTFFD